MKHVESSLLALTAAALAALAAPAALAHHSPALFDTEQVVTVEGVVTRYDWANPHVYIYLAETTEAGEIVEWEIEGFPPAMMQRQGWSLDTLHVGDALKITGNPARNADNRSIFPSSIEQADATLFGLMDAIAEMASGGEAPDAHATGLEGTWETLLSFDLVTRFFLDPASLGLTDAGAEAVASFDEQTMHPGLDCVPPPAPAFMHNADIKRLTTGDGVIVFEGENAGVERRVHLDVDSHQGATPSVQGHSVGRWEGDTLVIDTTHFAEHRSGLAHGLPSSPEKHLVERLTLGEKGTSLTYSFELSDPAYLLAPVTGEVAWHYRPDLPYEPLACDVETARRFVEE